MGIWDSLGKVSVSESYSCISDRLLTTPIYSEPTDTGMQRLALSDEDKNVRDWFIQTMKDLKCQVTVDEMGNIFAVRPGKRKDVPATFIGSHLDTQPTGGRYDGILGVLAGVEALKRMDEMGLETEGGVGVVNWTKYEDERSIARQN